MGKFIEIEGQQKPQRHSHARFSWTTRVSYFVVLTTAHGFIIQLPVQELTFVVGKPCDDDYYVPWRRFDVNETLSLKGWAGYWLVCYMYVRSKPHRKSVTPSLCMASEKCTKLPLKWGMSPSIGDTLKNSSNILNRGQGSKYELLRDTAVISGNNVY